TIQTGHGTRTDSPSIGRGRLLTTAVAIESMMNVVTAATAGKPRNTESLRAESVIGATLPNDQRPPPEARGGCNSRVEILPNRPSAQRAAVRWRDRVR